MKKIYKLLEVILFRGSKILLTPFFLGLLFVLGMYAYVDIKEIYHMLTHFRDITEEQVSLAVFKFIDMVMIAALVKMIITGSYTSYINKKHSEDTEKMSSGLMKVKLSTSILGVSSIHLLQKFFNISSLNNDDLYKLLLIHGAFIITAVVVTFVDYIHEKIEGMPHNLNEKEDKHGKL